MKNILILLLIFGFKVSIARNSIDSTTISKWHSKALQLSHSKPDSALLLTKQAMQAAKKLSHPYLIAKSYNIRGIYHDIQSEWDSALYYYDIVIQKAKSCDCEGVWAGALNNIGLVYWNQSENDKAISYYKEALNLFEKLDQQSGVANCLNNIGLILWDQRNLKDALHYQQRALKLRMAIDDDYGIGASLTNIGLVFGEMGEYDSSNIYLQKAEMVKKKNNDRNGLAIVYTNLGNTQKLLERHDLSGPYFKKAIAIHRELGNRRLLAANLSSLGNSYAERSIHDSAESALLEARDIAEEIEADRELYGILIRLGQNYNKWGKYELAASMLEKGISKYQEVYDTEMNQQITEIKEKYEAEKNQKEIAEQNTLLLQSETDIQIRNYLLAISFLVGIAIFLVFIAVYRQQKLKQFALLEENKLKDQLAEERLKNEITMERLRISSDLHDNIGSQLTFVISSIDNMLFSYKRGQKELQDKLEKLNVFTKKTIRQFRDTIWAMNRDLITAADLKERLFQLRDFANESLGKDVVALEFDEQAIFDFTAEQGIEVFRVLQESLNNALKYADAQNIFIRVKQTNSEVRLSVVDNGKGVNPDHITSGNGLTIMKQRADKIDAKITFESKIGVGSTVSLILKI